jgi:hypothetical protein
MTDMETLQVKLAAYEAATEKFLSKVETGQARSVETYRELLAAYLLPSKGTPHKLQPTGAAQRDTLVSERLNLRSDR